ncbi:Swt1 family HEPN domain-containing protein [Asticcacaulis sp. SL142]|uniref:Swt1 family HEPN domain-containing protein n=1 Tax=Asticcacaulis sp. SL142 TaxID=2995155 RepID=UPI00226CB9E9|nr:Swt1 family HEPN domain-containing protein [Asticcacaulis sp. SL142]WAC47403.1 Swt1 family HEPN domain-containing protein [Asticcacaulis sp. SL142]
MDAEHKIKSFIMGNHIINDDLNSVESLYAIKLGHISTTETNIEDVYYPQFEAAVRTEAALMAKHYEVIYCLEKSIRQLISETISEVEKTEEWWESPRVPPHIKGEVSSRITKERDAGVTPRSDDELDYTTLGELAAIITSNWDIFGGIFSKGKKAVERVMGNLNTLRAPIAHCSPLAEDEVLRLQLTIRDWFRLMS